MTKKEYDALIDQLIRYSDAYYKRNQSLINDQTFDQLMKQAQAIEAEHPEWKRADSPTSRPGSDITGTFQTIKHTRPMLSLENTYSLEDVAKWYQKMSAFGAGEIILEPKYDGNSFAARYVRGQLVQALTRGDGVVGEDITQNARLIDDLNHIDPSFTGEIRGEIIMTLEEFKRLNQDGRFANPRNLVSGTIKLLDPTAFKQRRLIAYAYWLEDNAFTTHEASLIHLQKMNFRVGPHIVCRSMNDIEKAIASIEELKKKGALNVDLDGAVLKVNQRTLWSKIGSTSKFPQWARAFKYEPESAITTLLDVEFWVGLGGKITPVAHLEPVQISGTTVSKASLSNFEYIRAKDIRIGDKVSVKKAAEIIPYINYPVKDMRTGNERTIALPDRCPSCHQPLSKWNVDHVDTYCKNEACPAQVQGILVKFGSVMDIEGLGEKLVERLYQAQLLKAIPDIYTLKDHYQTLLQMERLGEKSIDKLLENIERSKAMPLEKVIEALSIKNAGISTAKKLMKRFHSIDALLGATRDELLKVEDIGDIVAESLIQYFQKNRSMIERLRSLGVAMKREEKAQNALSPLAGQIICITGELSRPRKEYEQQIETLGGTFVDDVTKSTTILVTNDPNAGSNKLKKAQKFGTKIMSEKDLVALLNVKTS